MVPGDIDRVGGTMNTYQDAVIRVGGMACASCENRISRHLSGMDAVRKVVADAKKGEVRVVFDGAVLDRVQLCAAIQALGYEVVS